MPARTCARCGAAMPRNASARRKYCSDTCRKLASKRRARDGAAPSPSPSPSSSPSPGPATYRDLLEVSRTALMRNLKDTHCPATAVAGLSKELLELDGDKEPDPILDDPEEMTDGIEDEPFDAEAL